MILASCSINQNANLESKPDIEPNPNPPAPDQNPNPPVPPVEPTPEVKRTFHIRYLQLGHLKIDLFIRGYQT